MSQLAKLHTSDIASDITDSYTGRDILAPEPCPMAIAQDFNQLANDAAANAAARAISFPSAPATPPGVHSGTAYIFQPADQGVYHRFTSGSAVTVTVPSNASVPFAIGTELQFEQSGAGAVSVAAANGVTINSRGADLTLAGQYAVAVLKKTATDTWTLTGDL